MKWIIALALLIQGCATTQDKLQTELVQHTTSCICLLNEGQNVNSWNVSWKDKTKLKEQVKSCRCTVEFEMDEVEQPLDYIRPGTTFYQRGKGNPWDPDFKRIKAVE